MLALIAPYIWHYQILSQYAGIKPEYNPTDTQRAEKLYVLSTYGHQGVNAGIPWVKPLEAINRARPITHSKYSVRPVRVRYSKQQHEHARNAGTFVAMRSVLNTMVGVVNAVPLCGEGRGTYSGVVRASLVVICSPYRRPSTLCAESIGQSGGYDLV